MTRHIIETQKRVIITTEPPYHTQVWSTLPRVERSVYVQLVQNRLSVPCVMRSVCVERSVYVSTIQTTLPFVERSVYVGTVQTTLPCLLRGVSMLVQYRLLYLVCREECLCWYNTDYPTLCVERSVYVGTVQTTLPCVLRGVSMLVQYRLPYLIC